MKVVLIVILAVVVSLFAVVESGFRAIFGFGNPLLFTSDEQIGYLYSPNQRVRRFGNLIEINEYSMRSQPIKKIPASSTLRVLIVGDSIANGGWWTDQVNTIPNLIKDSLASANIINYKDVEVLNASSGSWGPRNELAYLQKFGNFNAQVIVLLLNTDDLFATAPTSLRVGRDFNYPNIKPALALTEVLQRYIFKPQPIAELKALEKEPGDRVGINLETISKIQNLAHQSNSQFLLVMTPLIREIGEPGGRDYEIKARQRLSEFTKAQQITYIDFLPLLNSHANPQSLYRDHIHFNLQGNQFVSQVMERSLLEILAKGVGSRE